MALDEKYSKGPFYLWSSVRNGGETQDVPTPTGGTRRVVVSRNVVPAGKKVTQSELDASDELWMEWVDGGVVRPYPYPDMPAGSDDSPIQYLQRQLNEAAQSEEERLSALVAGATTGDAEMVEAANALEKEAPAEEKKK